MDCVNEKETDSTRSSRLSAPNKKRHEPSSSSSHLPDRLSDNSDVGLGFWAHIWVVSFGLAFVFILWCIITCHSLPSSCIGYSPPTCKLWLRSQIHQPRCPCTLYPFLMRRLCMQLKTDLCYLVHGLVLFGSRQVSGIDNIWDVALLHCVT